MSQSFSSASNVILNNFSYFLIFILWMLGLNWYSFPHSPRPPGFFQVSVSQCALHVCRCQGCFCWLSNPKLVALLIVAPMFVWYNPKWFFSKFLQKWSRASWDKAQKQFMLKILKKRMNSFLCWMLFWMETGRWTKWPLDDPPALWFCDNLSF